MEKSSGNAEGKRENMSLRFRREIPDVAMNVRIGQLWWYRPRSAVPTFETRVSGI